MPKFTIHDTGVYRADPYVIVNELQEAVAQSVEKNGGHYAHGLREITDYITALESRLREAEEVIKPFAEEGKSWIKVQDFVHPDISLSHKGDAKFSAGDLKRAAAFLAGGDANKV